MSKTKYLLLLPYFILSPPKAIHINSVAINTQTCNEIQSANRSNENDDEQHKAENQKEATQKAATQNTKQEIQRSDTPNQLMFMQEQSIKLEDNDSDITETASITTQHDYEQIITECTTLQDTLNKVSNSIAEISNREHILNEYDQEMQRHLSLKNLELFTKIYNPLEINFIIYGSISLVTNLISLSENTQNTQTLQNNLTAGTELLRYIYEIELILLLYSQKITESKMHPLLQHVTTLKEYIMECLTNYFEPKAILDYLSQITIKTVISNRNKYDEFKLSVIKEGISYFTQIDRLNILPKNIVRFTYLEYILFGIRDFNESVNNYLKNSNTDFLIRTASYLKQLILILDNKIQRTPEYISKQYAAQCAAQYSAQSAYQSTLQEQNALLLSNTTNGNLSENKLKSGEELESNNQNSHSELDSIENSIIYTQPSVYKEPKRIYLKYKEHDNKEYDKEENSNTCEESVIPESYRSKNIPSAQISYEYSDIMKLINDSINTENAWIRIFEAIQDSSTPQDSSSQQQSITCSRKLLHKIDESIKSLQLIQDFLIKKIGYADSPMPRSSKLFETTVKQIKNLRNLSINIAKYLDEKHNIEKSFTETSFNYKEKVDTEKSNTCLEFLEPKRIYLQPDYSRLFGAINSYSIKHVRKVSRSKRRKNISAQTHEEKGMYIASIIPISIDFINYFTQQFKRVKNNEMKRNIIKQSICKNTQKSIIQMLCDIEEHIEDLGSFQNLISQKPLQQRFQNSSPVAFVVQAFKDKVPNSLTKFGELRAKITQYLEECNSKSERAEDN